MTTDLATGTRDGYQAATETAKNFICADCGGVLLVRFNGDRYQANCGRYPDEHEHIRSHADARADEVRERMERNPQVANALAVQGSAAVPLTTQALRDLSDEKLQSRIDVAFADVVDATPALRGQIKGLARMYGLDPLFDLMLYQKRPYVTYPGRLRKLREAPGYRGHRVRPLTREEKDAWGFKPEDIVVQCDADMGPHGIISDFGIVRAANESSPVARQHPQQLAIKRAITRTSNQAAGIDIPTILESSGRVIDVQEVAPRATLPLPDADGAARRRFWVIARSAPPDGLGLADEDVHRLLNAQTLKGYPGGWDQALSDLTERAAADGVDDESIDPGDMGEGGWDEASQVAENSGPSQDALVDDAFIKNTVLQEDARAAGVRGLGALNASQEWPLDKIEKANAELAARLKSRNSDLDVQAEKQAAAF